MADDSKGSGGTDPNAGGDPGENKDTVKYETHKKLLDEKKKLQAAHEELQAKLKAIDDEKEATAKAELEKKGELTKLLEIERANAKKLKEDHESLKGTLDRGAKLRAVLDKINGEVEEAYWPLLDITDVVIDEKSGLPDESSVQAAAEKFEKSYAKVISKGNGAQLPGDAPKGGKGNLTYDAWAKLPYKERAERMHEVAD